MTLSLTHLKPRLLKTIHEWIGEKMNEFIFYCITAFVFAALYLALKKKRDSWNSWISEAEPTAFHCLDEIINGKRWTGSNLKLVHSGVLQSPKEPPPGVAFREQLCKTDSGKYILITVIIDARVKTCRVENETTFDQAGAKKWLENEKDVYLSEFGPVENA